MNRDITVRWAQGPSLTSILVLALLAWPALAQNITKCQDGQGNWHYGDFAAEACAEQGTITEMNERGLEVHQSEAPPTRDELEAQQAAQKAQQQEAARRARQEARDRRLRQTYDSSQAIVRARDQRIEALDRQLESHRLFRQDLVDEKQALGEQADSERLEELARQIDQYDTAIGRLEQERAEVREKYNADLERYRALNES